MRRFRFGMPSQNPSNREYRRADDPSSNLTHIGLPTVMLLARPKQHKVKRLPVFGRAYIEFVVFRLQ